jgi:hypothetical protein
MGIIYIIITYMNARAHGHMYSNLAISIHRHFFLEYAKDMRIIAIKKENLTVQTTRIKRARWSYIWTNLADRFQVRYYINGTTKRANTAMSYGASAKSSLATPLSAGNSVSRASTWLDVKFLVRMASNVTLDAGKTGAASGATPNLCLRRNSPHLEAGMCVSD